MLLCVDQSLASIYLGNTFGWIFRVHNKPSAADTLESSRRVNTILLTNGRLQTALINIFADVLIARYLQITIATRTLIRSLRVTSVIVSHVLVRTAAYHLPECCCTLESKAPAHNTHQCQDTCLRDICILAHTRTCLHYNSPHTDTWTRDPTRGTSRDQSTCQHHRLADTDHPSPLSPPHTGAHTHHPQHCILCQPIRD